MPAFKLLPAAADTLPTTVGPKEHPKSPAKAKRANISVPPPRIFREARLKVPGQRTPTEKPQRAHPARPTTGQGDNTIRR